MSESTLINFHSEETDFQIEHTDNEIVWMKKTIDKEGKKCGEINYIFCSDNYLLQLNQEYLDHDTYTDIITFNYNEEDTVSADIYISIDRVNENATQFEKDFLNELRRVMIHGILHLIGYDDKKPESQATMRAKEDFYLNLHPDYL